MAFLTDAAKRLPVSIAAAALLLVMGAPAAAQWVKVPIPGTPRLPNGMPNLAAPTPRTPDGKPDLSGLWHADSNRYLENLPGDGAEAPMLPWAEKLYKERLTTEAGDKPQVHCLPHGVPDAMLVGDIPFKIVETPGQVTILYEEFDQFRQIFTDGRTLPKDPNSDWFDYRAWLGYSVGKWEGDTFVVDTTGFREGTWLDNGGHPHTDQLYIVERFRRPNFGNMELDINITDPKAYSKPWNAATVHFKLEPDAELIEHLCENETDAVHIGVAK